MRLTRYTDYALRVLIHLAAHADRVCSIGEIARAYGISQNHLMKVVNDLANAGFIRSARGRGGGIRLARGPGDIRLGDVVRHTEDGFALIDCSDCVIAPACEVPAVMREAVEAFMAVLDGYTLEDMTARRSLFAALLSPAVSGPERHIVQP